MQEKRGQTSLEYLSTVGIILIVIAGLVSYAFVIYPEYVQISTMNKSLRTLKSAVNSVYSLGPGNSETIEIEITSGIQGSRVFNNLLEFTYDDGAVTQILVTPNLHGTLPITRGRHNILVKAVDENVLIQEI